MKITSWWTIIAISVGVALVVGLLLGFFGEMIGLSPSVRTVGVGVVAGITAAILINRRQTAINEQKKS